MPLLQSMSVKWFTDKCAPDKNTPTNAQRQMYQHKIDKCAPTNA